MPIYSVVIPVYNSDSIVKETVEEVLQFFETTNRQVELVLVNDGSDDNSWPVIKRLAERDSRLTAINLLKNYGQHIANVCGLNHTSGRWVVTMDDDLQNPPAEIEKLITKATEGCDFVCGRYAQKQHGGIRRLGSRLMQSINKSIFKSPPEFVHTNFRLIHRNVVERIKQYRTFYPYMSGLCIMFSDSPANVTVEHHKRKRGVSGYSSKALASLALNIIFNYSRLPIRTLTTLGLSISVVSLGVAVYALLKSILVGTQAPGWASLVIMIAGMNTIVFFMLMVIGEFCSRMLEQQSNEKIYHIKDVVTVND